MVRLKEFRTFNTVVNDDIYSDFSRQNTFGQIPCNTEELGVGVSRKLIWREVGPFPVSK